MGAVESRIPLPKPVGVISTCVNLTLWFTKNFKFFCSKAVNGRILTICIPFYLMCCNNVLAIALAISGGTALPTRVY